VTVRDDGAGFDLADSPARHGMGLRLMGERAAEVGGELRVESRPGQGTTIELWLPGGAQAEPGFGGAEHPQRGSGARS
jgi:two-component system nitrate/nitrite sensor histidine kinase NarX